MRPFTMSNITDFAIMAWLAVELIFVVVFYRVWLPRFQRLRPPPEYRDYARDRTKLFMRIIKRMEANCEANNEPIIPTFISFLRDYFQPVCAKAVPHDEFVPKKGDLDLFYAWALFGKDLEELESWMKSDLGKLYETLESDYNLVFEEGSTPDYKPMRLTLDPLDPSYRPFFIYAMFSLVKLMSGFSLRALGFYKCKSSSGLNYFYRPPKAKNDNSNNCSKLPLLFLHGIAPGGLAFYLPMLFYLGGDGRPLFLFENPDITFCIFGGGNPPNEHQTVQGVWEAVDHHLGSVQDISVVGHSFGSCPITWLVHSVDSPRIRQIVLVDPITICLSEPDVMQNFLYQRRSLRANKMPIKIGVISNEIFTEHYLRRHFAWYNSELWLEDLPEQAKVLVCLSEKDPIVPVQKVQQQVLLKPSVEVLLWEDAGHAHCVTKPKTWRQIQIVMKRQEQLIAQESSSLAIPMGKKGI